MCEGVFFVCVVRTCVWSCGRSACFSLCCSTWARGRRRLEESRTMKEKLEKGPRSSPDPHWTLRLRLCSGDTGSKSRPSTRYTPSANQLPAAVTHSHWRRVNGEEGVKFSHLVRFIASSVITARDSVGLYGRRIIWLLRSSQLSEYGVISVSPSAQGSPQDHHLITLERVGWIYDPESCRYFTQAKG